MARFLRVGQCTPQEVIMLRIPDRSENSGNTATAAWHGDQSPH
jgi:hypothetical protein